MSEEQFWGSNPKSMQAYIKAEKIKINNQNFMMYIQGLYIYEGLCVALNNAFSKSNKDYRKEPIKILKDEETSIDKEKELLKLKVILNNWGRLINSK